MTNTKNYNLMKPDEDDYCSIHDQNNNMDIIDSELRKMNEQHAEVATTTKNGLMSHMDKEKLDMVGVTVAVQSTAPTDTSKLWVW